MSQIFLLCKRPCYVCERLLINTSNSMIAWPGLFRFPVLKNPFPVSFSFGKKKQYTITVCYDRLLCIVEIQISHFYSIIIHMNTIVLTQKRCSYSTTVKPWPSSRRSLLHLAEQHEKVKKRKLSVQPLEKNRTKDEAYSSQTVHITSLLFQGMCRLSACSADSSHGHKF